MRGEIEFKNRADGRLFLKTVKKNPLFREHFVGWFGRNILLNFVNEEQKVIVMEIISNVLNEIEVSHEIN